MPHTVLWLRKCDPGQTCPQTDMSGTDVPKWSGWSSGHVSFLGGSLGPLTSFTFSQNDMCLVFVAFATWAVRTSDLHTPDAWKTGLGALLGRGAGRHG